MLSPTPMARVSLVVLDRDLPRATEVLGRSGAVQLQPVGELGPWANGLEDREAAALALRLAGHRRRLQALLQALALAAGEVGEERVAPSEVAARLDEALPPIEAEVGQLARRDEELARISERLAVAAKELEVLARLPVDLRELRELKFLYLRAALVPERNLDRLRGSLAGVPHVLVPIARRDRHSLVLAFSSREHVEALERALTSAYAERADLPLEFTGTPAQALEQVQVRQGEVARAREELQQARVALAAREGPGLLRLQQELSVNTLAVEAWRQFGATERTRLMAGWVPAQDAPTIQARLQEAVGGRLVADVVAPPLAESTVSPPPTRLSNPPIIKPFETLVTTYGIPNYHELDPTPLAGFLFVLLFGVMFGDVGQGAVLALAGWFLTREIGLRGNRPFGWILMASGLSAVIFGALYGTVFLSESVIPALWFRPFEESTRAIELAIVVGIGVLTLGLALNLADAFRSRDWVAAATGRYGVLGVWFYWGAVLAAYAYLVGQRPGGVALFLLVGLPLLLLVFALPIGEAWGHGGWRRVGAGALVVSAVEVFDTAVRYVSNTVSFIRLAAFAIAHVGIGVVVLTLVALVRSFAAGAAILVVGNALVLGLEGLVVFIQALRLNYYELFTKFLRADGVAFRPFVLPGPRARR